MAILARRIVQEYLAQAHAEGRWEVRAENLQELIHATPFQPFAICMADGKRAVVDHPEFIALKARRPCGCLCWSGR